MGTAISNAYTNQKKIQAVEKNLQKKGFKTVVLSNENEVVKYIQDLPNDGIVGLGDSITSCNLKIRSLLTKKGSLIFYSWNGSDDYNRTLESWDEHPRPDYYLTRINAVTSQGAILLKDYSRNAATSQNFPKHIFAFAGINRIVEEFNETGSTQKYTVIDNKPNDVEFTVVLLPFMSY